MFWAHVRSQSSFEGGSNCEIRGSVLTVTSSDDVQGDMEGKSWPHNRLTASGSRSER